mgnify:FL=1|tara:strand:- start:3066 stop:3191 length:126 start_codon:yes stop_codon:yes gene_type:complete
MRFNAFEHKTWEEYRKAAHAAGYTGLTMSKAEWKHLKKLIG